MASEQMMRAPPPAVHGSSGSLNMQPGVSTGSLNMQPGGGSGSVHMQPHGGSGLLHMQPHGGSGSLQKQPGGGSGSLPVLPPIGFQQMQPPPGAAVPPSVSLQPFPPSSKNAVVTSQPGRPMLSLKDREELKHDQKIFCAVCQSIFVCLCCCWMIGIVSIVFSVMAWAASSKEQARRLFFITDVINLVGFALGTVLLCAGIVAIASVNA